MTKVFQRSTVWVGFLIFRSSDLRFVSASLNSGGFSFFFSFFSARALFVLREKYLMKFSAQTNERKKKTL